MDSGNLESQSARALKSKFRYDWLREHDIADDLKLMKWNDEVLGGKGFVNWYEFDHPQLGKVEYLAVGMKHTAGAIATEDV